MIGPSPRAFTHRVCLRSLLIGALLVVASAGQASTADDFLAGSIARSGTEPTDLPYRFLVPPGYDAARQYPLIVFLHGSGERGFNNQAQLANNANGALQLVSGQNQTDVPAFMLAPQLSGGDWGGYPLDQVARAIVALESNYSIDRDRICVTGLSLGGAGTYAFVSQYADLFAAAAPLSGFINGDPTRMSAVPMWAFHAVDDASVSVAAGDMAVAAVRNAGGRVIYTRYQTGGHPIWPTAYGDPTLFRWLMAQRRHRRTDVAPFIAIASPGSKYPTGPRSAQLTIDGNAAWPSESAFQVYGMFTPPSLGAVIDGTGATLAAGTTTWSIDGAPDAAAMSFMALARAPSGAHGLVGGGYTTVNDLVWLAPAVAVSPPIVAVGSPTSAATWQTPDTAVDLTGSVTSTTGNPVQQVLWNSDKGTEGVARYYSATNTWTVSGVPLEPGDNRITIRARSQSGSWGTAQLLVHSTVPGAPDPTTIVTQPQSLLVAPGASAILAVTATGTGELAYQWKKDGAAIAGATGASLQLAAVTVADAGNYAVVVSAVGGTTESGVVALAIGLPSDAPGRLQNLSARAVAGSGDQTLIVGFVVAGDGTLPVLVRGAGPALKGNPFGVTGALPNPALQLYHDGFARGANDDWTAEAAQAGALVGAFPFPTGSKDAALIAAVAPGNNSAHIVAPASQSGVALAEVYDASAGGETAGMRLSNLSVRASVGGGDAALIGGFVIGGTKPVTVLIRAVGPALRQFQVDGVLEDPVLELHTAHALLQTNDDWSSGSNALEVDRWNRAVTFPLPSGSKDAALLATLMPGAYSALVRGADQRLGVALLEVYEIRAETP